MATSVLCRRFLASWRARTPAGAVGCVLRALNTANARPSLPSPPETRTFPWTGSLQTCLNLPLYRGYTSQAAEIVEKVNEAIESQAASKVFAVVHISGKQFKIAPNDLIVINRIPADIGAQICLEKVLLAGCESFSLVGTPLLSKEHAKVTATVIEHTKTAKVVVFKKKRRKNYKRKKGHRQDVTVLRVNTVDLSPISCP